MFKKIVLVSLFYGFLPTSWAIPPISEVYRIDTRSPEEIRRVGGMRPRAIEGHIHDDDLAHHFEGESVEGGTSNFVSTTGTIQHAIDHLDFVANDGEEEDQRVWIYLIRPTTNFYNVNASIAEVSQNAQNEEQRRRAQYLINSYYTGMDEYAAQGGFNDSRIISYIGITRAEISNNPNIIYDESLWERNPTYDQQYDQNTTNTELYPYVGVFGDRVLELEGEGGEVARLANTCMGVSNQGPLSLNSKSQYRGLKANATCLASLKVKSVPYYDDFLKKVAVILDDENIVSSSGQD